MLERAAAEASARFLDGLREAFHVVIAEGDVMGIVAGWIERLRLDDTGAVATRVHRVGEAGERARAVDMAEIGEPTGCVVGVAAGQRALAGGSQWAIRAVIGELCRLWRGRLPVAQAQEPTLGVIGIGYAQITRQY